MSHQEEVAQLEQKIADTRRQIFEQISPWDRVKIARHPKRPFTLDYISAMMTDFTELHGDRLFADDHAVVGGLAKLNDQKRKRAGTPRKTSCAISGRRIRRVIARRCG